MMTKPREIAEEIIIDPNRRISGARIWFLASQFILLEKSYEASHARCEKLESAVMHVIECARACGDCPPEDFRKLELLPNDSVMVADLLRGLGLPIGDYP